jgi:hypothetical protein
MVSGLVAKPASSRPGACHSATPCALVRARLSVLAHCCGDSMQRRAMECGLVASLLQLC